jgi:pyridoxamine 5'-phosphate oxidase
MLDQLLQESKKQLSSVLKHKKHPFRYFTLTTIALDGSPHSRTVVLRGFDPEKLTLTVYTDKRSSKFEELSNDNRAELLFYDPGQLLQIVIKARLIESTLSDQIYSHLPEPSKKDYCIQPSPGKPIKNPDQVEYFLNQGFLVALKFEATQLEYLKLKRPNHLRAKFLSSKNWEGVFLAP